MEATTMDTRELATYCARWADAGLDPCPGCAATVLRILAHVGGAGAWAYWLAVMWPVQGTVEEAGHRGDLIGVALGVEV